MKKKVTQLLILLIFGLCGCASEKATNSYPSYFVPIVEQLEIHGQYASTNNFLDAFCDRGVTETDSSEFDWKPYIGDTEEENWLVAGTFRLEEGNKTYQCWYDTGRWYEVAFLNQTKKDVPQLFLVEYEDSEVHQVTPYIVEPEGEFSWYCGCYRIGEKLYIAGDEELAVIDLHNMELRYCKEEQAAVEQYAQEIIGEKPYHVFFFRAVFEQDGVTVYSAEISEANDMLPVGMIFVAVQNKEPIAYMNVDLTTMETADRIDFSIE